MSQNESQDRSDIIENRVKASLAENEKLAKRLHRTNAGLLIAGVVSSASSTLVAGVTAAGGPVVGSGTPGWRLACTIAAVLSFGATVAIGVNQRLKIGERLAESRHCAGRLRAMEIAMATGSRDWHNIAEEYEELMTAYPDFVR
jgi:hypothetical protein